jgi:hypothetical protein
MYVTPDCFGNVSPAHLLSTLGHETIHYLQNLRNQGPGKNPRDLPGKVQAFIQDFREWEAYVWEVFGTFQEKDYKYENDVAFACTSDERRFETGFWGDCYNLRIIKRLWVLSGGGYERELALLRAWLAGDDFGNAWLAVNASTFVEVGGRDYTPAEPKCSPCDPPCSSGSSCDTTNGKCMPTSP